MFSETDKIELKEKINDTLPKEIESFLNTDGGTIYIGVDDDGVVVGVNNIDAQLRNISDIISDQIEPNSIDCVRIEVEFIEGKMIIKIVVKKGYASLYCVKKYGFSSNGCHYRIGTTCKSMTLEMIRHRFEQGFSEIDMMVRRESFYRNMSFIKFKMLLLENGYHIEESTFERNFKLRTNDGNYNFLAELLSDENSLSFIFAKFKGKNKATFSERSDYGKQCIILAYEKMKERLKLENICKTITNPRPRRDIYLYDMDAVNEALVNAIIHNDYRSSDPQIDFFDNRLEITSHGGLPNGLTKEEFFNGISKPRNEQLTDIFSRLGIVEHTGHGIPVIVEKYGKTVFEISNSYIRVVIPFNKEVLLNHGETDDASGVIDDFDYVSHDIKHGMRGVTNRANGVISGADYVLHDAINDIRSGVSGVTNGVYGAISRINGVTNDTYGAISDINGAINNAGGAITGANREKTEEKENQILKALEKNSGLSAKDLSETLNIPFRSVQRYISNLREKGFIRRIGANKKGYWKVIK